MRDDLEPDFLAGDPEIAAAFDAAVEKERELRDLAFLNAGAEIAGIPVVLITLRQVLTLVVIRSPFVVGGDADPEDIERFLWLLNPGYDPDIDRTEWRPSFGTRFRSLFSRILPAKSAIPDLNKWQRLRLQMPILLLNKKRVELAIRQYIEEHMMDAPGGTGEAVQKRNFSSFVASYIDTFAHQYGWSRDTTLDTPIAQLYQLLQEIGCRLDPDFTPINPLSDQVVADQLARKNTPELKAARVEQFAALFRQAPPIKNNG